MMPARPREAFIFRIKGFKGSVNLGTLEKNLASIEYTDKVNGLKD